MRYLIYLVFAVLLVVCSARKHRLNKRDFEDIDAGSGMDFDPVVVGRRDVRFDDTLAENTKTVLKDSAKLTHYDDEDNRFV